MFNRANSQGDLNGFLGAGSHMNGELQFEDTFRILGKFTGTVVSDGELVVDDGGLVDGEIRVRRVIVSGAVKGAVHASERIEITPSGKVEADLFTPALMIEEGAFFEGSCTMVRDKQRSEPADLKKVAQMPLGKERR